MASKELRFWDKYKDKNDSVHGNKKELLTFWKTVEIDNPKVLSTVKKNPVTKKQPNEKMSQKDAC